MSHVMSARKCWPTIPGVLAYSAPCTGKVHIIVQYDHGQVIWYGMDLNGQRIIYIDGRFNMPIFVLECKYRSFWVLHTFIKEFL